LPLRGGAQTTFRFSAGTQSARPMSRSTRAT